MEIGYIGNHNQWVQFVADFTPPHFELRQSDKWRCFQDSDNPLQEASAGQDMKIGEHHEHMMDW